MDRQSPLGRVVAAVWDVAGDHVPEAAHWCVALSGGADSLALTAAAARVRPTTALVVDHGLQTGSDTVAERARAAALDLGLC